MIELTYIIAGSLVTCYLVIPMLITLIFFSCISRNKKVKREKFPVFGIIAQIILAALICSGTLLFDTSGTIILIVAAVWFVIRLIVITCIHRELKKIKNIKTEKNMQNFLQSLRNTAPSINIFVRCWHIEVYYTYETHRDSNGNTHSRQVRHERDVTTFVETRKVHITGWFDQTASLVLPQAYSEFSIVSLDLKTDIFMYQSSGQILAYYEQTAYEQNRGRDQMITITTKKVVPNLTEHNFITSGYVPWYLKKAVIIIGILFAQDVALALYTRSKIPNTGLIVRKCANLQRMDYNMPDQTIEDNKPEIPEMDRILPPDDSQPTIVMKQNELPLIGDEFDTPGNENAFQNFKPSPEQVQQYQSENVLDVVI
ncbi:Transmembrane domain-containing protein [Spironucleus salmonicida]|uniref:Transmembrane domain-containing protein n=1 Tax=Spironucleus salmonicida TaxID=348837 RepID=V6M1M7_9EUKA|nr:Transmembrane domain-containing protein [Spironucleus salmonicida]|eukprot:EST47104.1 Transmembrane domain-containing protein [Spironucleus salmonicida]